MGGQEDEKIEDENDKDRALNEVTGQVQNAIDQVNMSIETLDQGGMNHEADDARNAVAELNRIQSSMQEIRGLNFTAVPIKEQKQGFFSKFWNRTTSLFGKIGKLAVNIATVPVAIYKYVSANNTLAKAREKMQQSRNPDLIPGWNGALFSKRTEISGSNDKYSNSETAFLLQKIEEYDGMSILATNYYRNFDSAFIRRITYAVNLRSPDEEQRYELWRSILPAEAEISGELDFRLLAAQFDLSGSNIKAILYSAAYMAGAEGAPLSMRHVAKAMQYEYKKLGRLINSNEFGPLMAYLN